MTATLDPSMVSEHSGAVPARHGAWLAGGLAVAVACAALGAWSLIGGLSHAPVAIHRTWNNPVRVVDLHLGDGSVTIVGSDRPGATVDATGSRGLSTPTDHETLERGTLTISSSCPLTLGTNWCSLSYLVALPRAAAVTVHAGDGSVQVSGVTAALSLSSSDGSITVTAPSGALQLHSSDGSIHVTGATSPSVSASSSDGSVHLGFARPPSTVSAHSSDGSVTVGLPSSAAAYRLDAHSSDGHVSTPINTSPTSARRITATSSDGSVTVRYGAA
jgi:Putative adhesin